MLFILRLLHEIIYLFTYRNLETRALEITSCNVHVQPHT